MSDKDNQIQVTPSPDWSKELAAFSADWRAKREAAGLSFSNAPSGDVPIGRLWAFARAVRAQPDVWERCVVQAEKRKHEVADPDSELRWNEEVWESTNPENFLLDWQRFVNFCHWFLFKTHNRDADDTGPYLDTQFILRMWCRGDVREDDRHAFVAWFKDKNWPSVIYTGEDCI